MATRMIGSDIGSRAKLVAMLLVVAIGSSVLTLQASAFLSTTSSAVRTPVAIRLNELPTGPQHGEGPHPYKIHHVD
jgi:hypothetical protein